MNIEQLPSTAGYGEAAETLAEQYESVTFAEVHRQVLHLFPTGGRVILSLRHGPVPTGRRMFPVSAAETIALARTHGLHLIHLAGRVDAHGRQDISWTHLALQI